MAQRDEIDVTETEEGMLKFGYYAGANAVTWQLDKPTAAKFANKILACTNNSAVATAPAGKGKGAGTKAKKKGMKGGKGGKGC